MEFREDLMKNQRTLTPRRALLIFLLAIAGSITGTLAAPHIVAAFDGAPAWLLPAILAISVLLALIATYTAFHLATSKKQYRQSRPDGEA
jgi:amino acid transporter